LNKLARWYGGCMFLTKKRDRVMRFMIECNDKFGVPGMHLFLLASVPGPYLLYIVR
jgi:hypothetical protein